MVERLRSQGIKDEAVLDAMAPCRAIFSWTRRWPPAPMRTVAADRFRADHFQSPYCGAHDRAAARRQPLGKVLEIGTGCGYQTAVLARLAQEVYSVERIAPLLMKARGHLREIRAANIKVKHADGSIGLEELGPFDGIIMTAAATHVPEALLPQLAVGGRMVFPIGTGEQRLCLIEHTAEEYRQTTLEAVKFVPLLPGLA